MNSRLSPRNFAILLLLLAIPWAAPATSKSKKASTANDLDEYLKRARATNQATGDTPGSLWAGSGPYAFLAIDYRAVNAGDLIVIHLVDTFNAATNGENKQSRNFAAQSALTNLVGKLSASNSLQNLFNGASSHSLDGAGASTMSSSVSMNLSAAVLEVLPNGVLVIQASRDITVGNDRQTVTLRGLVRPGDLAMDDSIASTSIADLQVEIKGKGAVAEASRQSNPIVRMLLRLFVF